MLASTVHLFYVSNALHLGFCAQFCRYGYTKISHMPKTLLFFSTLISTLLASALACSCFSAAAMLAERRAYLYLGGFLAAASSMLLWLETTSLVFGGSASPLKFQVRDSLAFLFYV